AAFELFKDEHDKRGLFLTWSYIVDTFMYEWKDFHPLDHWIRELELLIRRYNGFDSTQIEDLVTCRMFCALMFRQPQHQDLPRWKEKAEHVMYNSPDKAQSLFIGYNLVVYNLWMGRVDAAGMIVFSLASLGSRNPLPHLMWLRGVALYYNYAASYEKAMETITRGLTIAEETGIHLLDLTFFGLGIYCAVSTADVKSAEDFLSKIESTRNSVSCFENIYYHHQAALVAQLKGECPLAVVHAEECLRLSKAAGFPFFQGIQACQVAAFLIQSGKYDDVAGHIAEGREIGKASHSAMLELIALFLEAFLAMQQQDNGKFIHYARKAFALSRETGIKSTMHHGFTHLICLKAFEVGVDVDYVQELIRLHHIVPDKKHFHSENWPWQLKIHTLGPFELKKDDKPVAVMGKIKKPLELLKALIAFGGENVAEERLIDALWPDADGDLAHRSFDTTLHRLRKLIGNDKALQFQTGSLSLDPRYCWLDTRALERCCTEIEVALKGGGKQDDEQGMEHLFEKASTLYGGEFLAADAEQHWAASMREQMKGRYSKVIGAAGRYWAGREQWDKATAWFRIGIEVDNLAEEFYQGIMVCYRKQGQTAQAVKTYQRCCSALSAALDVGPSLKTKEIYNAIIHPLEEERVDATRKHQRRRH
ncbi:MAG: BTAD domain-containing putative transcriptional regulator, partial [Dissulfurispiraceae bacterium]